MEEFENILKGTEFESMTGELSSVLNTYCSNEHGDTSQKNTMTYTKKMSFDAFYNIVKELVPDTNKAKELKELILNSTSEKKEKSPAPKRTAKKGKKNGETSKVDETEEGEKLGELISRLNYAENIMIETIAKLNEQSIPLVYKEWGMEEEFINKLKKVGDLIKTAKEMSEPVKRRRIYLKAYEILKSEEGFFNKLEILMSLPENKDFVKKVSEISKKGVDNENLYEFLEDMKRNCGARSSLSHETYYYRVKEDAKKIKKIKGILEKIVNEETNIDQGRSKIKELVKGTSSIEYFMPEYLLLEFEKPVCDDLMLAGMIKIFLDEFGIDIRKLANLIWGSEGHTKDLVKEILIENPGDYVFEINIKKLDKQEEGELNALPTQAQGNMLGPSAVNGTIQHPGIITNGSEVDKLIGRMGILRLNGCSNRDDVKKVVTTYLSEKKISPKNKMFERGPDAAERGKKLAENIINWAAEKANVNGVSYDEFIQTTLTSKEESESRVGVDWEDPIEKEKKGDGKDELLKPTRLFNGN